MLLLPVKYVWKIRKKCTTRPLISLRCGRMNGRMRDKRLTQSPCKFERRQLNVPYTTIFIRLRHVKSKWPSLLVERFTQFGRFVKFLKMFFEVDHNPKGIWSKQESNFVVSSKLEAKITYTRLDTAQVHMCFAICTHVVQMGLNSLRVAILCLASWFIELCVLIRFWERKA